MTVNRMEKRKTIRVPVHVYSRRTVAHGLMRSLDRTYRCMINGFSPREVGTKSGFWCEGDKDGHVVLYHKNRMVPEVEEELVDRFDRSGITLHLGRVMLLDPVFVLRVVRISLKKVEGYYRELEESVAMLREALRTERSHLRDTLVDVLRISRRKLNGIGRMRLQLVAAAVAAEVWIEQDKDRVQPPNFLGLSRMEKSNGKTEALR